MQQGREIEQWSKENIKPVNHQKIYNFLQYDKNITYDNKYLALEYSQFTIKSIQPIS